MKCNIKFHILNFAIRLFRRKGYIKYFKKQGKHCGETGETLKETVETPGETVGNN